MGSSTTNELIRRRPYFKLSILFSVLALLAAGARADCFDPDKKIYQGKNNYTNSSIRDKMSDDSLYCDITISWNVSNETIFDQSKHDAALAIYKGVYEISTDTIDSDRKVGPNRDCLAILYKIVCAYTFPMCVNGTEMPGLCTNYCDLLSYRCPTVGQR